MTKLTILTVIAVSVSAQFVSEQRPYDGENLRISNDAPRGSQDFWEDDSRANQGHMHESTGDRRAGGFQNGNFAHSDGRLRTNLDYNPPEYSGQNFQPRYDSPYVVEEGAAFRSHDKRQPDVHSSQGRINEDSFSGSEDGRKQTQSLEQTPRYQNGDEQASSQRDQHANEQTSSQRDQHANEQTNTRSVNNNQNNQDTNSQSQGQSYSQQSDQNTNYNHPQLDARNSYPNSKQSTARNKPEIIQNSQTHFKRSEQPVTNSTTTNSAATDEQVASERDKEAIEKEINNQITKMYFDASVLEVTPNTKTPTDHKTESARNNSGKEDDRWIWNMTSTSTTENPGVDDRAAFVGDDCPSDQAKFNGVCVDKD